MKAFMYLFSDVDKIPELKKLAEQSRKIYGSAAFGARLQYIIRYLEGDRSDDVFVVFFAALLYKANISKNTTYDTFDFDNIATRGNILDLDKFKSSFEISRLDSEGKYLLKILEGFKQRTANYKDSGAAYVSTIMTGFDSLLLEEDTEMQNFLKEIRKCL